MASPACRRSSCERDEMVFQYSTPATSQSSVTPLLALTANRVELQGVLSSTQSGEGEVDGSGSGIGIRIKKDDRDNTLAKLRELQTVAQALYTTPDPPPLPYIVDHLFFPPRLPENGDSTPTKEFRLLLFVWEVATQFHSGHVMIGPTYKHMQHVVNMLEVMVKLHGPPWPDLQPMGGSHDPAWKHGGMKLPQELLLNELSGMREGGTFVPSIFFPAPFAITANRSLTAGTLHRHNYPSSQSPKRGRYHPSYGIHHHGL